MNNEVIMNKDIIKYEVWNGHENEIRTIDLSKELSVEEFTPLGWELYTENFLTTENKLGIGMGTIYKERSEANVVSTMSLMGNVENKICIIVDDMIDTAGTATKASKLLKEQGAEEIYMFACHGLFSGKALENISNSEFDKVIVTNTLNQNRHSEKIKELNIVDRIEVLDVSWMCAEAIKRSKRGESLTELYDSPIVSDLEK